MKIEIKRDAASLIEEDRLEYRSMMAGLSTLERLQRLVVMVGVVASNLETYGRAESALAEVAAIAIEWLEAEEAEERDTL